MQKACVTARNNSQHLVIFTDQCKQILHSPVYKNLLCDIELLCNHDACSTDSTFVADYKYNMTGSIFFNKLSSFGVEAEVFLYTHNNICNSDVLK